MLLLRNYKDWLLKSAYAHSRWWLTKIMQSHSFASSFKAASSIRLCNFSRVQPGILKLTMSRPIKRFALFSMMLIYDVKSKANGWSGTSNIVSASKNTVFKKIWPTIDFHDFEIKVGPCLNKLFTQALHFHSDVFNVCWMSPLPTRFVQNQCQQLFELLTDIKRKTEINVLWKAM